jgi:hypothetical protein
MDEGMAMTLKRSHVRSISKISHSVLHFLIAGAGIDNYGHLQEWKLLIATSWGESGF